MKIGELIAILKRAVSDWLEDDAPLEGAALAFYGVLSLSPFLVFAVSLAAVVFEESEARRRMIEIVESLMGREGGEVAKTLLQQAQRPEQGRLAAIFGVVALIVGASGVFYQLKHALNAIWEVPPRKSGYFLEFLWQRIVSLLMMLVGGVWLLVALAVSVLFSDLAANWPDSTKVLRHGFDFLLTMMLLAGLFATIFRWLPDARPRWRDVWGGAILTALLFSLGKLVIALYLRYSGVASTYGAAGSLVAIVIWIYYSAQIFLFGAELTHAYARHRAAANRPV